MENMENYDSHPHIAKRQRTDGESGNQRGGNFYNYNNQQRQSRGGGSGGSNGEEEKTNHILLMTILNPAYPITVDVIHTISSPSGQVLRIVIFKKNGVQAMVEFEDQESAKRAKQVLHGADIYSGCCTLKIEYAKPTRLNVYKNDSESWDYTNPTLGKNPDRPGPLLQEPRYGGAPTPYQLSYKKALLGAGGEAGRSVPSAASYNAADHNEHYDGYGGSGRGGSGYGGYGGQPEHYGAVAQDRYAPLHDRYSGRDGFDARMDGPPGSQVRGGGGFQTPSHSNSSGVIGGGQPSAPQQGSVLMVYGLNHEKINGDRIFNLFCLYGNVVRVKFLKSKEGCAMVQMGDGLSVERVVRNLNNSFFFNSKMQLGYSKQAFLNDVPQPYELPDGTPSFKDYMGNRNNRFTNPESAGKNRIQPPSKILHFFNTPHGITEEDMKKVFEGQVAPPTSVKVFASKSPAAERSSSGLLEWETTSDALEALIICNHTPIQNPKGKFPYVLKLCFSSSSTNSRNNHQ